MGLKLQLGEVLSQQNISLEIVFNSLIMQNIFLLQIKFHLLQIQKMMLIMTDGYPFLLIINLKKKQQDKFLLNKLTTKEELSGLLNYSLKGLKRLLDKGMFSYKKNSSEIKKIMERHSNSLAAFVQDVLIEKEGNRISKDDMFNIYSIYVKDKKLSKLSKSQLGRRLPNYAPYILAKIDKIRFWDNVDITDLHIDTNTFNALQKIITVNVNKEKERSIDYLYKNSAKALKTLNDDYNKKQDVDIKTEPKPQKSLLNGLFKKKPSFSKQDIKDSGLEPELIEKTMEELENDELNP